MSRSVESVVIGLSELSCQVDVITHRRARDFRSCILGIDQRQGYRVFWCGYPLCSPSQIADQVGVSQYDLLYVNGRGFARLASYASDVFQTPVVYCSRSDYYQEVLHSSEAFDSSKARLQEILIALSDRIIVSSSSERKLLQRQYQLDYQRIRRVRNPLHPRFMKPPPVACERKHGRILFAGRYVAQKGIGYLIEAVPKVIAHNANACFVFVGGHGDKRIWELLDAIESRFGPRVRVRDWLPLADLVSEYHRSQVVIVPSLYEPFGNVALEAMGCGCAVVATSVGGLAETLTDHSTGLLVEPGDSDAIAAAVVELLDNQLLAQRLSIEARRRAIQEYSYDGVSKTLLRLFTEMVELE